MIYCVEDDDAIRELMIYSLKTAGFEARGFADAEAFWPVIEQELPDLVLLDVMMPGQDGISILQQLRSQSYTRDLPVVMATARGTEIDKVQSLDLGADDYLVKPFSMEELVLKIEIFINRSKKSNTAAKKIYTAGTFRFDPDNFILLKGSEKIILTQREAELLQFFLDHKNEVLKREQILTSIWGQDDYFFGRSLDVFVSRLRKIFAHDESIKIENLHGIGYKLIEKMGEKKK